MLFQSHHTACPKNLWCLAHSFWPREISRTKAVLLLDLVLSSSSLFPWLTSPYSHLSVRLAAFLTHPPSASGFSSSPFLSMGTARSLMICGITGRRVSREPCPCLVSPLSSSIRNNSLLSPRSGKEGLERELLQILALRTQKFQPCVPWSFLERAAESAGQNNVSPKILGRMGQWIWDFPPPLPSTICHSPNPPWKRSSR